MSYAYCFTFTNIYNFYFFTNLLIFKNNLKLKKLIQLIANWMKTSLKYFTYNWLLHVCLTYLHLKKKTFLLLNLF